MLRMMILLSLAFILLVMIATQVLLPMFTEQLDFFWLFKKKGAGSDDISFDTDAEEKDELRVKAQEATENYKSVKKEIRSRKKKLDKLDRATDI